MKHTRESIIALIDECRKNGSRIDLGRQDLHGLDLSCLDLRWANLKLADLRQADLRYLDLRWADLQDIDLQKANLQEAHLAGANLQGANLKGANLQGANLDSTGYELSCKTIGIIADKRLVSQLLYHLCCMDVQDCPEWDELRNDERLIALANKSHVIREHGLPGIKRIKAQEEK